MPVTRLELDSADQVEALAAQIRGTQNVPERLQGDVATIIDDVRKHGDSAVRKYGQLFDGKKVGDELPVAPSKLDEAVASLDRSVREGLEAAIANVGTVARAELEGRDALVTDLSAGQSVELRDLAVESAGIYVPGGTSGYPSTVVMGAVPAAIAGVSRRCVVSPPGPEGPRAQVLAACALCEVDEVYSAGGAHIVAALALGTETVAPVDVIVGPGNPYVQEAKRQLFGTVGIDSIAGPSELVIVADGSTDPIGIALDLAAQAEHGVHGLVVLISEDGDLIEQVASETEAIASRAPSVSNASCVLVSTPDLETSIALANELAPEHLELQVTDARSVADGVTSAGCIFLGASGATAFGDYVAGSNHVLPTGGAARFQGPLGVNTFRRRQALVSLPAQAAAELAPYAASIARAEGFPVHAESVEARAKGKQ